MRNTNTQKLSGMIIKNQKQLGELIFHRLTKTCPTYKDRVKFAAKAGLKERMLYKICRGSNTRFDTMLRILGAAGMSLNISNQQLSKLNGKKKK